MNFSVVKLSCILLFRWTRRRSKNYWNNNHNLSYKLTVAFMADQKISSPIRLARSFSSMKSSFPSRHNLDRGTFISIYYSGFKRVPVGHWIMWQVVNVVSNQVWCNCSEHCNGRFEWWCKSSVQLSHHSICVPLVIRVKFLHWRKMLNDLVLLWSMFNKILRFLIDVVGDLLSILKDCISTGALWNVSNTGPHVT